MVYRRPKFGSQNPRDRPETTSKQGRSTPEAEPKILPKKRGRPDPALQTRVPSWPDGGHDERAGLPGTG